METAIPLQLIHPLEIVLHVGISVTSEYGVIITHNYTVMCMIRVKGGVM